MIVLFLFIFDGLVHFLYESEQDRQSHLGLIFLYEQSSELNEFSGTVCQF